MPRSPRGAQGGRHPLRRASDGAYHDLVRCACPHAPAHSATSLVPPPLLPRFIFLSEYDTPLSLGGCLRGPLGYAYCHQGLSQAFQTAAQALTECPDSLWQRDKTVKLWDLVKADCVFSFANPLPSVSEQLHWSPSGKNFSLSSQVSNITFNTTGQDPIEWSHIGSIHAPYSACAPHDMAWFPSSLFLPTTRALPVMQAQRHLTNRPRPRPVS